MTWDITGNLSIFVFFHSIPLLSLVLLYLAKLGKERIFELGQISQTKWALFSVGFCPNKRWPFLLIGTEKAFLSKIGSCFDFAISISYTKSRKNFFVLQFQLLGTKMKFLHWQTIMDVNRCPSDLLGASPVFKSKVGLGSLC